MSHDDDRAAILKRRTFFVTSALAALGGCAGTPPAEAPASPPAASTVEVPSATASAESAPPPVADAGAVPEPVADPAGMPPLLVPAGVSDKAKEKYERLNRVMTDAHKQLGELEQAVPAGCSPADAKCETRWRAVAAKLEELNGVFRFFYVCPGTSDEAKAYEEHQRLHTEFYQKRRALFDERVAKAVTTGGDPAAKKWAEFRRDAQQANPQPCLKFACADW